MLTRRPDGPMILNFLHDRATGGTGSGDEISEQALGKRITRHAFGMPLDAD